MNSPQVESCAAGAGAGAVAVSRSRGPRVCAKSIESFASRVEYRTYGDGI